MISFVILSALSIVANSLVIVPASTSKRAPTRCTISKGRAGCLGAVSQSAGDMPVIELTLPFENKSPADTLRELSEIAESRGIKQQDVYGAGAPWMTAFEAEVACLLGKEAAVFCPSGVMAQLIALKIHACRRRADARGDAPTRNSFLCHPSSHILLHEEGAHDELIGFDAVSVGVMERPASLEDLREALDNAYPGNEVDGDGTSAFSPACFVLELPHRELGGACTSGKDVKAMSELLGERGVAFHCDGARLWEAQPWLGESFEEICKSFDSVYVSFYKGLDGMTGAMLVGTASFIAEARVWLRRFGGNVFTSLPYALSCSNAFGTYLGTFEERWGKLERVTALVSGLSSGTSSSTSSHPLVRFEPAVPQCSMVHCYIRGTQEILERARDGVLQEQGVKVFSRLRGVGGQGSNGKPDECYFEWNMGPVNGRIDDEVFVEAWKAFLEKIADQEHR